MRRTISSTLWIIAFVALFAGDAIALLTISLDSEVFEVNHNGLVQGDTYTIDVYVESDGAPGISGIFVSTYWDPARTELIGTTQGPFVLYPGPNGLLTSGG